MNNTLVGIIVLILVVLVGWFAYSEGYFAAEEKASGAGLDINIGGTQ